MTSRTRSIAVVACILCLVVTTTPAAAAKGQLNLAVAWNQVMLTSFATANVPAPASSRLAAIVSSAVFDAVNGVQRAYTPIHVEPAAPADASPKAAVASAAHDALVALFPTQQAALDAALASSLANLGGDEDASVADGIAWGSHVAAQVVAWRAADGFGAVPPAYVFKSDPGQWQPTPGGSGAPRFRTLATTTPFALVASSQFRPLGPPALDSARYLADLAEVKLFGRVDSSVRTAWQTETARFWQLDTPPAYWDRVADSLATASHLNLLKTSRALALLNIALADSSFAVFDAKSYYNSWRPVTAIAPEDPSWQPLMTTPYFQEYPSAHSGISSAGVTILESMFGSDVSFTVSSAGLPGVERSFTSFDAALEQVGDARVWAGFHFRFACDDGIALGRNVGAYVATHLMRPAGD
jgi:hypothetical protein